MKNALLLLSLLTFYSSFAQMSADEKNYVDSLKQVVKNSEHDSVKVNALIAWDDVIWRYDPDMDIELNERVQSICGRNLKKGDLDKNEIVFYKKNYAKAVHNLGTIHFSTGDYAQAVNLFTESLTLKEEIGDLSGAGASINNIGNIYLEQGNNEKAKEYYERSRDIFKKLNDELGLAGALGNLGLICANQKDYKNAIKYQEQSLEIRKKMNDLSGIAVCLSNIGQVYNEQKEYDKALEFYKQGYELYKQLGDSYGLAQSLNDFGNTYLLLEQYDEAIRVSQKAANLAKERNAVQLQRDAYKTLYKSYEEKGDLKLAFDNYKLFVELSDSLVNQENQKEIIRQQFKYEYEVQAAQDSVARDKERKIESMKYEKKSQQMTFLWIGLGLIIIFSAFIFNRFRVTRAQKQFIEKQKIEVENINTALGVKNREILDSIQYAKRIQNAILPPESKLKQHLGDHFVMYRPKDIVAGDFYWLEQRNGVVLFAVGDCTGHGVPGAMVSVVCNNGLNRSVREHNITDPGEILNKTRDIVIEEFEKSDEDVKDGMDIALCALKESTLLYAGANNPLWIVRNGELIEYKADKQPIGKFDHQSAYVTNEIQLEKGDSIYLFTDGFADQFGGNENRKYMIRQFKELVLSMQHLSMQEQAIRLNQEFDQWKMDQDQVDDVCVMGMRV